jgi:hypothetical protein
VDDRSRYLSLATYRASGAEVATPVWFVSLDGTLYVFTADNSGKVSGCGGRRGRASRRATRGDIRVVPGETPPLASSPTRQ